MAITSFPFQDIAGDRLYSDVEFAKYYAQLFQNGVIATIGNGLQVKQADTPGMSVLVSAGACVINGRQMINDADHSIVIAAAGSVSDRYDSVVAQLNMPNRVVTIAYKEGSTAVQRDANIYELQLATIKVAKNVGIITAADITDKRGNAAVCGYSTPYEKVDLTNIEAQFNALWTAAYEAASSQMDTDAATLQTMLTSQQSLFNAWFADLQDTLATNVEANLQAQIDALDASTLLTTITHNLNEYPHVRALAWDYGIGLIGLGNEAAGLFGGTNVVTVPCAVEYLNRQGLKVSIPVGYAMLTPTVTQLNSREWLLTSGTKSLQITLMEAK